MSLDRNPWTGLFHHEKHSSNGTNIRKQSWVKYSFGQYSCCRNIVEMSSQQMVVLVLLICLSLHVVENEAAAFPWSCPSLSGVCRKVCLPTELFFGPLGCGKGFLCCVSHFL